MPALSDVAALCPAFATDHTDLGDLQPEFCAAHVFRSEPSQTQQAGAGQEAAACEWRRMERVTSQKLLQQLAHVVPSMHA